MGEIDLATHEPMRPMLIDGEGLGEQMDAAVLVAAAHEDHGTLERGTEVKLEAFDGILEAWFARWGKHWDDTQCQTQPTDTPDGVGELVRSLED